MTVSPRDFDRDRGLYNKYVVTRIGGTPHKHDLCDYFILDWRHDPYAVVAARAYAQACEVEFPVLAKELRQRANEAIEGVRLHRLQSLESALLAAEQELSLMLCQCPPRREDDVRITLIPSTHDFSCPYRTRMQCVLRALEGERVG